MRDGGMMSVSVNLLLSLIPEMNCGNSLLNMPHNLY